MTMDTHICVCAGSVISLATSTSRMVNSSVTRSSMQDFSVPPVWRSISFGSAFQRASVSSSVRPS